MSEIDIYADTLDDLIKMVVQPKTGAQRIQEALTGAALVGAGVAISSLVKPKLGDLLIPEKEFENAIRNGIAAAAMAAGLTGGVVYGAKALNPYQKAPKREKKEKKEDKSDGGEIHLHAKTAD